MTEQGEFHHPELQPRQKKDTVLVIGGGFSGTVTAMRLLHNATKPLEVTFLEKTEERRHGGIAYSNNTAGWEHLLNIQAGRITAFREDPDDFVDWANDEADRDSWPIQWKEVRFQESTVVARRMYQQYLGDRLDQAVVNAAPGVTLRRVQGEAIDLVENGNTATVTYVESSKDGSTHLKEIEADKTVIATGHVDFNVPNFAEGVKDDPFFAIDQYSPKGREVIKKLGKDETAFIIGTGLTAFDAVISLLERGHEGPIIMSSRHGYTHFTYPEGHIHEILRVRRPQFLNAEKLSMDDVVSGVTEEFFYVKDRLHEERPDMSDAIHTERILKAWEPYVAELVQRLPAADVQALFTKYRTLLVTSRIGTIPEIGNRIAESMRSKDGRSAQVQILKGEIETMVKSEDEEHITISVNTSDGEEPTIIEAGAVISGIGQQADYTKVTSSLWRNLIDRHQTAIPHKKTNRGIEVGEHGELINSDNQESTLVYAVGPMRQGQEVERRGRLGAFVFSIGAVRNQAFDTAITVVDRLTSKDVEGLPALKLTADSEDVSALIAEEALRITGRQSLETDKEAIEQKVKTVIDWSLSIKLVKRQKEVLATRNPLQKQEFDEEIASIEEELAAELIEAGIEQTLSRNIVQEATKQRVRIAVRELTNIAYLAEKSGRKEYVVYDRSAQVDQDGATNNFNTL